MRLPRIGVLVGVAATLVLVCFLWPERSAGCGPFFSQPVFTFSSGMPYGAMVRGELGIIQSGYGLRRLAIAYRFLSGIGLNDGERKALAPAPVLLEAEEWKRRDPVERWQEARKKVAGTATLDRLARYRPLGFSEYPNCTDDAFLNATRTLSARMRSFGAGSPEVAEWLRGQDKVFLNCGEGNAIIPGPVTTQVDPVIRADRAYQIAAAHFYARNLDAAMAAFRAIAADRASPWHTSAPYLVARSLIRKATLVEGWGRFDAAVLADARAALKTVLADPSQESMHAPARRLLGFVRLRLEPEQRLHELAKDLLKPGRGERIEQDLTDYLYLLNPQRRDKLPKSALGDDLTDWLLTFRGGGKSSFDHAVERWKATRSLEWLVAVLAKTDPGDPATAELLNAAARVKPGSPAFPTVAFHRIRLLAAWGDREQAWGEAGATLARRSPALDASARNLFLAARMRLARNLDEFLRDAPRRSVGAVVSDNPDVEDLSRGFSSDLFDADAAAVLNRWFPLDLLKQAALSPRLPAPLRREVALTTWVRAVLLDDEVTARALAAQWKPDLDVYLAARSPAESKFAAALVMLRGPGLRPYVSGTFPRKTALQRIDDFRDNWWCAIDQGATSRYWDYYRMRVEFSPALKLLYASGGAEAPGFLSPGQRRAAITEWEQLRQLPAAPTYLGREVVRWGGKNLGDPRVPEALYLAVRATRYGCTDEDSGAVSKQAFQMLHRHFAGSEWAKRTPYWF